jgi:hypothetical protein
LAEILEQFLKAALLKLGWLLAQAHGLERLPEQNQRNTDLAESATPPSDALAQYG